MITCDSFRSQFTPATEDAVLLEHVRTCDACLSIAAEADPDIIFRSIGGGEMIPPGGLDAFVGDVMREVRLRETERQSQPVAAWSGRLAAAAALAAVVTGGTFFYQADRGASTPAPVASKPAATTPTNLINRPVVEEYDSANATIVEVPTDSSADVKVVMIFDEELPADL